MQVTELMLDSFREAWNDADDRGDVGNRVRAGLENTLPIYREHLADGVAALGFLTVARLIREDEYMDNPRTGHKTQATEHATVLAVTQLELQAALAKIRELEGNND